MYKKLIALFALISVILTSLYIPNVYANDLVPTTNDNSVGVGNYAVTVPSTQDQKYNITMGVVREYDDGTYVYPSNEVYYVEILNQDGTQNDNLSGYYRFDYIYNSTLGYPEVVATINDIPAGSKVIVKNIQVEKIEYDQWGGPLWSNYKLSYMSVNVANANPDSKEIVLIDDEADKKKLVVDETTEQTTKVEEAKANIFVRETEDTLLSVSGHGSYYDQDFLTYLLSAYNVISLDEIHSTHIVGPIISQNVSKRTKEKDAKESFLAASDYSRGIPSYVGEFSSYLAGAVADIGVKFNYSFDFKQTTGFTVPVSYSDETGLLIHPKGEVNNLLDHYVLADNSETISANNTGLSLTYQNDDYIDFVEFEKALKQASNYVLENGNAEAYPEFIEYKFVTDGTIAGSYIEVYESDELIKTINNTNGEVYNGKGFSDFISASSYANDVTNGIRLTINMEESWTISDATNLQEINMILPEDYDYYDNPFLLPTTVSFDCEYINPAVYQIDTDGDGVKEDVVHSRMPYTLVNGTEFTATLGANGEYGEVGNKIIWNMPKVNTDSETGNNRLTVLERSHNIAGHIVAPGAEFWNYDTNQGWLGGNLNGGAIVKSFHSGIMEMHMWAYEGLAEQSVVYGVKALKTVDGHLPEREYRFLLDVVYDADGNIPEGILNTTFPMTANSSLDKGEEGLVHFTSIAFNKEGEYSFILKEDTSMDKPTDNIVYDLTEYKIVITVDSVVEGDLTKYFIKNITKYKIKDQNGNDVNESIYVHDFTPQEHKYETKLMLTFDNKTTSEEVVNLHFIKKCTSGHVLSGAKFHITEMTSATDDTRPSGGYIASVTSDVDGIINITGLKKDTYYKIWEYEAPQGHILEEGYWVAHIGPHGFLLSIEAKDGASEIGSDNVIYNEHIEEVRLDLSLTKKNQMNRLLAGVDFSLQGVMIDENGVPQIVHNGFNQSYETDINGQIHIENLEAGRIYMLKETTTPAGHVPHTGYWLISVTGDPLKPEAALSYTITEYDVNHQLVGEVSNDTIYNEKEEFKFPTTGGVGKEIYYFIGFGLIIFSLGFYKRKKLKY